MTLQNVIIFGLGAVAGAAMASLVLKDKYKKQYENLYKDELESYRESFENLRKMDKTGELIQNRQFMGVDEERVEKRADSIITGAEKKLMGYASIYSRNADSQRMKEEMESIVKAEEYVAESESPRESDVYETYEETQMRKVNEGRAKREEPRIIRADEYDNEFLYHTKKPLLYYTVDDILVEEDSGDEVDDVEMMIGDALDKYGFRVNDEMVIYVRNVNIGMDFEITKVNAAFSDEGGYYNLR